MKNKKIYLSPPQLSGDELKNIEKVLDSGWISPNGPEIKSFEKEFSDYLKIKSSLALSSGTAALHLALRVLNVKKNDYVFCSDLTFVASANVIKYVGATPIFIDSNNYDLNICPESLELAFKKFSPKAVIVTNIYGQSANYIPIIEICKKYETPIVEDAAESLEQNTTQEIQALSVLFLLFHSMETKLLQLRGEECYHQIIKII